MTYPADYDVAVPTEIALGVVTFLLAVLGGVVSAHAPTKKRMEIGYISAFIVLGVVGSFFIVKQSQQTAAAEHRAEVAQIKLSNSIDKLSAAATESQRVAKLNTELQEKLPSSNSIIERLSRSAISTALSGISHQGWLNP